MEKIGTFDEYQLLKSNIHLTQTDGKKLKLWAGEFLERQRLKLEVEPKKLYWTQIKAVPKITVISKTTRNWYY